METKYSVSEFYMLLKLGIWKQGVVNFWGQAEILPSWNEFLLSKNLHDCYNERSPIKKHLGIGLYMLDLFYIGQDTLRNTNIYQMIVAVCRSDMRHMEALYNIRVTNSLSASVFFESLNRNNLNLDAVQPHRSSYFNYNRRSRRNSLSSNIPIGSRYIQHRSI